MLEAGTEGYQAVSYTHLDVYKRQQYSPSLMLAYRMAEVFHVTVEELCCLEENKRLEDQKYEEL